MKRSAVSRANRSRTYSPWRRSSVHPWTLRQQSRCPARCRHAGGETANVDVRVLKGLWTEESAYNAVGSWLKLNVAKDVAFGLVAGQNDAMALGARRAFQELTGEPSAIVG